MKQQLQLAFKFFTLAGAYLFTRSRTPADKRRYPERSIVILLILDNLKRFLQHNVRLINGAENQVELLERDIRLFKAFLEDYWEATNTTDLKLEELAAQVEAVVAESDRLIAVFRNLAAEVGNRNLFRRALGEPMEMLRVAKEVQALRAKVRNVYDNSSVICAARKAAAGGGG